MPEDVAVQRPSTFRSLGIGLFWFTALLAATSVWTGLIEVGALPDVPWSASNPSVSVADDVPRGTPSGIAAGTGSMPLLDEVIGAPEPVPGDAISMARPQSSPSTSGSGDSGIVLSVVGPQRRTVGSRAEFVVTVINESGSDLPDSTFTLAYDSSFRVREASVSAQYGAGFLRWNLGTLLKKERVQIQVEFECTSAVPSARLSATVAANDRPISVAGGVLAVDERPDLDLRMTDTADPLESGQQSTFVLEVENHASLPTGDIVIHLIPTPNIRITGARVGQGSRQRELQTFVNRTRTSFRAAPLLAPGGRLICEIEFQALGPGAGELRALLDPGAPRFPREVCEPIVINPPSPGP